MSATLVLLRHGESVWNKANIFTGWTDVELSDKGKLEAREAGEKLNGYTFDKAYCSVLKRAIDTLQIALEETGQTDLPVVYDVALNERHYGDLQGLNKDETREKYGKEQVHIWRRSYDVPPPGKKGESLKDTAARVLPYYQKVIEPDLLAGKAILISAHGNSLRSLVMFLDDLTREEVLELNIPTGVPLQYTLNAEARPLDKKYL